MQVTDRKLMDRIWSKVEPVIPVFTPSPRGGRPRVSDRVCFEAIMWILLSGARWGDLTMLGLSPATCWRRFRDWSEAEVWDRVWVIVLGELDSRGRLKKRDLFLDACFCPAKKGGTKLAKPSEEKGQKSR